MFILILLLLCILDIVMMQVGDFFIGESKELLQPLPFFVPHGGSCAFYLSHSVVLLVALVRV